MTTSFAWPNPHPPERVGRPSRKAATAALKAHVAVLGGEPLRRAVTEALHEAGNLGGQERRFVAFATRELSRHMRLLDFAARQLGQAPGKSLLKEDQALVRYALWRRLLCGGDWARVGPEVRLPGPLRPRSIKDVALERLVTEPLAAPPPQDSTETALAIRHSFPSWLMERLSAEVAPTELGALLESLNREPAVQLRVRPPRTPASVHAVLVEEGVASHEVEGVASALVVDDPGLRVFETRPMREGALQVQDVGSQLIVALCGRPAELTGRTAADVCAGAGGKALALADAVGNKGRVLAGDTSRRRLQEARERARQLGLRQVSFPSPLALETADVVLVDAPCSGTGSLAREPDTKWRLTAARVSELARTQRELLESTAEALRPGAVLVYATCSVLREENEGVVEDFLARHAEFHREDASGWVEPRFVRGGDLRVWPHHSEGGGFYAARLRRR